MKTNNFAYIGVAAMCAVLPASPTLAEKRLALEEVVVTAQRKEESLQDTPVALDAFNAEALEREGINNIGDLANNVPALNIAPFPINTTTLRIYIRGIGLIDAQITQDPPIGVYIDGGYIARSAALATDIADLERVEVLRGPQGTLYGRNSTGGAVNLVTKRPNVDETEFKQSFTFGNRDLFISKTSLNVPLWEGAAAKFAYYHKGVDGWIENTGLGDDFGDNDTKGYRVDVGWDVSETLRADYAYDHTEVDNVNLTYDHILPTAFDASVGGLVNSGARQFFTYNPEEKRPDKLFSNIPMRPSKNEIDGHQLTLNWDYDANHSLKYILAYRELFDQTPTNNLATGARTQGFRLDTLEFFGFPVAPTPGDTAACTPNCVGRSVQHPQDPNKVSQEQFSHEIQLSGSLFDDRLSYIGGVYYFEEEADTGAPVIRHLLSGPLGSTQDGNNTGSRIEVMAAQSFAIKNTAAAIYSQLTWRPPVLEDKLAITLGARHSEDSRDAENFRRQVTFAVTPGDGDNTDTDPLDSAAQLSDDFYDVDTGRDFADDSFSLIVEWDAFDDVNFYGKYSEAYKSGGFNVREPLDEGGAQRSAAGFDEEKVNAIELGMKARFFENRLQVNAAIFDTEIKGQQLNFTIPGSTSDTTVANAGTSTLRGGEMDATWLAAEGLILIFNYAYLDSSIDDTLNPLSGEVEDDFVFDSTPRHAYTGAIDWTVAQTEQFGRIALNATYSFTDERNGGATGEFATFQADKQDDFAVLNARLGAYEVPALKGSLNVALWGKNLTDEEYSLNNIHNLPEAGRSILWAEPRTYGLDLIYFWGG